MLLEEAKKFLPEDDELKMSELGTFYIQPLLVYEFNKDGWEDFWKERKDFYSFLRGVDVNIVDDKIQLKFHMPMDKINE